MSGGHFDMLGKRFGHLTITGLSDKNKTYPLRRNWMLLCDCGNETFSTTNMLTRGYKTTCGKCVFHSRALSSNATHRQSKTKLYRVWYGMLERCENSKNPNYKNYGARGISVCEEWRNSYQAFYYWAMQSGYKEGLSIDRIDNNGCYAPINCRWCSKKEQAQNRRSNVFITYKGDSKTVSQWESILGLGRDLIRSRLSRGWSVNDALSVATSEKRKEAAYQRRTLSVYPVYNW